MAGSQRFPNTENYDQTLSNNDELDSNVYGLVNTIEEDLEAHGLESSQIAIDVYAGVSDDGEITAHYKVETYDWFSDGEHCSLSMENEPISFTSQWSTEGHEQFYAQLELEGDNVEENMIEEGIKDTLKDNLVGSTIRINEEVVRNTPSPDYNHLIDYS